MILNISKIKTEALLLFCRDLIDSYKTSEIFIGADKTLEDEFKSINDDMYKQINNLIEEPNYYIKNRSSFRIKAILNSYNYINKTISKILKPNERFNPSMLYFSLLALWFNELNKESNSKEYIFFILYPYSNIYDKFLIKIENSEYKKTNIKMIEIAEEIVRKYDNFTL